MTEKIRNQQVTCSSHVAGSKILRRFSFSLRSNLRSDSRGHAGVTRVRALSFPIPTRPLDAVLPQPEMARAWILAARWIAHAVCGDASAANNYSDRKATIGSTWAARCAGTKQARRATPP